MNKQYLVCTPAYTCCCVPVTVIVQQWASNKPAKHEETKVFSMYYVARIFTVNIIYHAFIYRYTGTWSFYTATAADNCAVAIMKK